MKLLCQVGLVYKNFAIGYERTNRERKIQTCLNEDWMKFGENGCGLHGKICVGQRKKGKKLQVKT